MVNDTTLIDGTTCPDTMNTIVNVMVVSRDPKFSKEEYVESIVEMDAAVVTVCILIDGVKLKLNGIMHSISKLGETKSR